MTGKKKSGEEANIDSGDNKDNNEATNDDKEDEKTEESEADAVDLGTSFYSMLLR